MQYAIRMRKTRLCQLLEIGPDMTLSWHSNRLLPLAYINNKTTNCALCDLVHRHYQGVPYFQNAMRFNIPCVNACHVRL
jgi:hypothetical protein